MDKNKIDDKLYKVLKEALTVHHESGSITEPLYDEVEDVHDAIYNHYKVKELQHSKQTTVGLYVIDFDPKELLNRFNNSQSDAHSIECEEWERLLEDWNSYIDNKNIGKSPFDQIK